MLGERTEKAQNNIFANNTTVDFSLKKPLTITDW
jgi:hypothetical protein